MSISSTPPGDTPNAIDCITAVRRLWDYLDGRLSPVAHDEVEAHLSTCQKCPPHFMFAERMKRSLAGASAPAMSRDDEARLQHRVRDALRRVASEPEK
jgi:anti-sigma factor RsiW